MSDTVVLSVLEFGESERKTLSHCVGMRFSKERYTPFSTFKGDFFTDNFFGEIIDVELYVNGFLIHKGVIDVCEQRLLPTKKLVSISSKGYTFSLGYTELAEGIRYGLSLDTLMTPDVTPPFVSCEQSASLVNYLYIKEHSTLWDAVVNLCLKGLSCYPYIAYTNTVRFSKPQSPKIIAFDDDAKITAFSSGSNLSNMISDLHMRDVNGNYNAYNAQCGYAVERNIERHKHLSFDRHWLSDMNRGLGFKLDFFSRGREFKKISYKGFNGEDINDCFLSEVSGIETGVLDISAVEILAGKNGVITTLTAYSDGFCNVNQP